MLYARRISTINSRVKPLDQFKERLTAKTNNKPKFISHMYVCMYRRRNTHSLCFYFWAKRSDLLLTDFFPRIFFACLFEFSKVNREEKRNLRREKTDLFLHPHARQVGDRRYKKKISSGKGFITKESWKCKGIKIMTSSGNTIRFCVRQYKV